MGRNFYDYPGLQPFRSWGNTYAQEFYELTLMDENKPTFIKYSFKFQIQAAFVIFFYPNPSYIYQIFIQIQTNFSYLFINPGSSRHTRILRINSNGREQAQRYQGFRSN